MVRGVFEAKELPEFILPYLIRPKPTRVKYEGVTNCLVVGLGLGFHINGHYIQYVCPLDAKNLTRDSGLFIDERYMNDKVYAFITLDKIKPEYRKAILDEVKKSEELANTKDLVTRLAAA